MQLRPYQEKAKAEIYQHWQQGARNVLLQLPTGAGKTVTFSDILHEYKAPSYAIAHRHELVSQMSLTLGRYGVYHNITASDSTIREIVKMQQRGLGRNFFNQSAPCTVAGVDTLVKREISKATRENVGLWVVDEAHHVLKKNKWGRAVELFPNAFGLGPSASPRRADGKGLSRESDGYFDAMVQGPCMRELIEMGSLTKFKIYCPPSDMDVEKIKTGATGDYTAAGLKAAAQESHIVGDVVAHYLQFAAGKLGVTFATDTETAADIARQYRDAGVPAEVITAKTPARIRAELIRRFANRELLQLVNVDLFGEGFDLPAIEVVSMARPTQSLALFIQQFGRALRLMPGKEYALIIDHVGNCVRHGLQWMESSYPWSLDPRPKRAAGKSDALPVRVCTECALAYEGVGRTCPYCGHTAEPAERSAPEFVDGVLSEMTPEALAALRGVVAHADRCPDGVRDGMINAGMSTKAAFGAAKNLRLQQASRDLLRESIALYAGALRDIEGNSDDEIYYRFYQRFDTDILTAQTLGNADTLKLNGKIRKELERWQL